jgi:hypothetical protein
VAVVQYASSRGEQRTLASGPGRASVRLDEAGQGGNLALSRARLKQRIRRIDDDVPDSEEKSSLFLPLRKRPSLVKKDSADFRDPRRLVEGERRPDER